MKHLNYGLIFILLVSFPIISGCGKVSDQNILQLNEENLMEVLTEKLGKETSYGFQRISMAKTGKDINFDQRNATMEVLGSINFDRFATVRFALEKEKDHNSLKQALLEDMHTIYQVCFSKFGKLDDLLIFAEFDFGEEDLKSVALSHMSRSTAKEINWDSFPPAKIPKKADYFEWIRSDF
jgi:hypothetical protein